MKKIIRNIIKFLQRFVPEDPKPAHVDEKPRPSMSDIINEMKRVQAKDPMELLNMKLNASAVAREAHERQNVQIDKYFGKVLSKHVDPFLLGMYRESKMKIPGLEANLNYFMSIDQNEFGRHVKIWIAGHQVGEAIFTATLGEGEVRLDVNEIIKVEEPATPKSAGSEGASHP